MAAKKSARGAGDPGKKGRGGAQKINKVSKKQAASGKPSKLPPKTPRLPIP